MLLRKSKMWMRRSLSNRVAPRHLDIGGELCVSALPANSPYPLHGVRAILPRWAGTTSPSGSGHTQHGLETKDDPKGVAWLWFAIHHQYLYGREPRSVRAAALPPLVRKAIGRAKRDREADCRSNRLRNATVYLVWATNCHPNATVELMGDKLPSKRKRGADCPQTAIQTRRCK